VRDPAAVAYFQAQLFTLLMQGELGYLDCNVQLELGCLQMVKVTKADLLAKRSKAATFDKKVLKEIE